MMKKIVVFVIILINMNAQTLKNFTSDGCTMFLDGTPKNPKLWQTCCIRHDIEYWMGGSYEERLEADRVFEACIDASGTPKMGSIMYIAVRVGGAPYLYTPFRWGFGWDYGRWYQKRTIQEQKMVEDLKSWWPLTKN